MTSAYDHLWKSDLRGSTEKLRENLPPRLGNCQAMYDKEQRLTEENQFDQMLKQSSIMIFSENSVLVIQLD